MRKLFSFILVVVLCLGIVVPASAAENINAYVPKTVVDSNDVGIRAEVCPICNKGALLSSSTYTSWVQTGNQRLCTHYPYGTDVEYTRVKITTTSCNYCDFGYIDTTDQYGWVCEGHY